MELEREEERILHNLVVRLEEVEREKRLLERQISRVRGASGVRRTADDGNYYGKRGQLSLGLRLLCAFAFCAANLYMARGWSAAFDDGSAGSNMTVAWVPIISPGGGAGKIDESAVNVSLIEQRLRETHDTQNKSWERPYVVPHFFVHTPKTAGFSLHDELNDMVRHSPFYRGLPPEEHFRVCNLGTSKLVHNRPLESYKGTRCSGYMAEAEYDNVAFLPRYAYALIRNPRTHVVSQYFHCSESNAHRFSEKMPSLDDWLTRWYAAINNPYIVDRNDEFKCYNPINMQSSYVGFQPERGDTIRSIQQKFAVIGPMEEIDKVACVMFIHWGGWVPKACNCTTPHTTYANSVITRHSVTHHGSTFNTSKEQQEKIEWLVEKDNVLYQSVKTLFRVQSRVIEERYGFKLCERAGDFAL